MAFARSLPLMLALSIGAGGAIAQTAGASAPADNCETIRAGIDAKIRPTGVSGYTLSVVAADARVAGKVVGSCALGSKKIVYATPAKPTPPMLTECRDGTVTTGDCKKP